MAATFTDATAERQDGLQGGASPGSTVGAGYVYLIVATPITL